MKTLCLVALSLALASCHPHKSSAAHQKKTSSPIEQTAAATIATISADPNPVPAGPGDGETTVIWDTGEKQSGEVYVTKNGNPEELFASGRSGASQVKWIQAHTRYEFRLYEGSAHSKLLGKVEVKRQG